MPCYYNAQWNEVSDRGFSKWTFILPTRSIWNPISGILVVTSAGLAFFILYLVLLYECLAERNRNMNEERKFHDMHRPLMREDSDSVEIPDTALAAERWTGENQTQQER